ncbi:MAG: hypothetical protein AAF721_32515, partial [Myxococcota bacterium]
MEGIVIYPRTQSTEMKARSLVTLPLALSLGMPAVALTGTVAAMAVMLTPSVASAADTGTISGVVTDAKSK